MLPEFEIKIQETNHPDILYLGFIDVTNGCVLDMDFVRVPSNLRSKNARFRFMSKRIDLFVSDVTGREVGSAA